WCERRTVGITAHGRLLDCAFVLYFLFVLFSFSMSTSAVGHFFNFSFLGQGLESSFAGFGCELALSDLQMCLKVCVGN
ncbi:MAG: hypothetical protein AB8B61_06705, partial [Cyclobacteriaceae bacterium]